MIVKVVCGHGGVAPGYKTTSYLIDGKLLVDACSVASGIPIDEQVLIDNILISHSHLDHISDLAFLADNCFRLKGKPFEIHASKIAKVAIDSCHHTPKTIMEELKKMPEQAPIFLGHIKPNYQTAITVEMDDIGCDRISLLSTDDTNFVF